MIIKGFPYITMFNFVPTVNSLIFPASQYFLIISWKGHIERCPIPQHFNFCLPPLLIFLQTPFFKWDINKAAHQQFIFQFLFNFLFRFIFFFQNTDRYMESMVTVTLCLPCTRSSLHTDQHSRRDINLHPLILLTFIP